MNDVLINIERRATLTQRLDQLSQRNVLKDGNGKFNKGSPPTKFYLDPEFIGHDNKVPDLHIKCFLPLDIDVLRFINFYSTNQWKSIRIRTIK